MSGMRALGSKRLSDAQDSSVSIAVQDDAIEFTVKARGDRLVHVTEDTDVSGAVSPFERPELGPWLTEPDKIAQWDYLIVSKLDRLSRSLLDWQLLLQWCDKHGKAIVSVSEGIDFGSQWGRLMANILIMFAEFERMRIGERRKDASVELRATGRWNGGVVPYGYRPICACHGKTECKDATGWKLEQSAEALVVRRIVDDILDGVSQPVICRALNEDGIPTPQRGKLWRNTAIQSIIGSRYLRGELQYKGHSVLDQNGTPVLISDDPILTEEEWSHLQQTLRASSRPHRGQHETNHLLIRIAFCGECDAPLYYHRNAYRCANKANPHPTFYIKASEIEDRVERSLLREYGDDVILRRVVTADYSGELRQVQQELDELEELYMAHNLSAERFASMSSKMEARISELRLLASKSKGEQWEPTGETVRQRWEQSGFTGRRAMLMRLGLCWRVSREFRVSDRARRFRVESDWLTIDEPHERLQHLSA
jgi:DNA invertase Pin-like site-specific DNA recombinase